MPVPVSALVFVSEEVRSVLSVGCTVHIRVVTCTAHTVWIGVVQCNKQIEDQSTLGSVQCSEQIRAKCFLTTESPQDKELSHLQG